MTVVLAHGASAYVLVAKYRCDVGDAREATAIRLTLPAAHGAAFAGREAVGGPGTASLLRLPWRPTRPGAGNRGLAHRGDTAGNQQYFLTGSPAGRTSAFTART